ncbi:MAG: hypothetical protein IPQ07_19785 [Myxococcales bacterium]|nr:hypothetical protein [Myxococcales bacterium]
MRAPLLVVIACAWACGSRTSDPPPAAHDAATREVAAPASFEVPPPTDKVLGIGRDDAVACAVHASGGVDCWGRFGFGKIFATPRRIPGVSDAIAISTRGDLVLRKTGQVVRLAGDRIEFVPVEGIANVAAFASGASGCFLQRDHSVTCAGSYLANPRTIPGVDDAVSVTNGAVVCAVRPSGEVLCAEVPSNPAEQAPFKSVPGLGRVRRLELADQSGCAILESGELRCFAIAGHEVELRETTTYDEKVTGFDPVMFKGATEISVTQRPGASGLASPPFILDAVIAGRVAHWDVHGSRWLDKLVDAKQLVGECALRAQGSVACWGSNRNGELGLASTIGRARRKPAPVVGISDVAMLALRTGVSWAVTRQGKIFAWGSVGGGTPTELPLPSGAKPATSIAVTKGGNACALAGDAVYCWTRETPTFALLASGIRSIANTYEGVIALKLDGTVVSWKLDKESGYVPAEGPRLEDKQLPPVPARVIALVGMAWPCAVTADRQVFCGDEWAKVPVDPVDRISGTFGACGITGAGAVRCWDYNFETKRSTPATPATPSPLAKVTDALDLGLGDSDFCIVRAKGAVWCGMGPSGRERLVLASGAVDVEVGGAIGNNGPNREHGCAIMADRTVMCWGGNFDGELGDGSITYAEQPIGLRL